MGLIRKTSIESYWNHGEIVRAPYFGTYMSQNNFQNILSNFHIVDNSLDVPKNRPGHDPLFCVRPMIEMMERTFWWSYKPGRDLSFDEGCMPFHGRVKFRCYNPSKPVKYHIKLFEVNDARTGYCLGFDVYTGEEYPTTHAQNVWLLDPSCNKTTKIVVGLMDSTGLLDKGHHIYMDNYYTSADLFEELHFRNTFACGTINSIKKYLPQVVVSKKMKNPQKVTAYLGKKVQCYVLDGKKRSLSLCLWPYMKLWW